MVCSTRSMVSLLPRVGYYLRESCRLYYHVCKASNLNFERLSTTNHLERLDPALTRPGRMDVWVEFKNASKWQAELLFHNFFSEVEEEMRGEMQQPSEAEIAAMEKEFAFLEAQQKLADQQAKDAASNGVKVQTASTAATTAGGASSGVGADGKVSFVPSDGSVPSSMAGVEAMVSAIEAKEAEGSESGASTPFSLLPPPLERPRAPLGPAKIAALARTFGSAIPDGEHSVASLQGCE